MTLDELAATLSSRLNLPVVNRTGINGSFEIDLQFALERNSAVPPADAPQPPTTAQAIRDQLGLRLESAKEPIPLLVVESGSEDRNELVIHQFSQTRKQVYYPSDPDFFLSVTELLFIGPR